MIEVSKYKITNSKSQKLLGIEIDNKLTFNDHVCQYLHICTKASQKLHALSRISNFMSLNLEKLSGKASFSRNLAIAHLSGCFIVGN